MLFPLALKLPAVNTSLVGTTCTNNRELSEICRQKEGSRAPVSQRCCQSEMDLRLQFTRRCLSLFLKQSPLIDELAIYDNVSTYGDAVELNYIDTRCKVSTCTPSETCLRRTLEDSKIVAIVADRIFEKKSGANEALRMNGNVLSDLLPSVIRFSPRAMIAIAMNPINSLIPLAMEMYKKAGIYEHPRLFGVITLDCVRANILAAEVMGIEPECLTVPVIGGSCPKTSIPVFSRAKPCNKLSQDEAARLTSAVRQSDEELSKLNEERETSSIAMAFATARFCVSLCKAVRHQIGVVECAYVRSCVVPQITYFAAPLELGPDGIQRHLGIPPLDDRECKLLETAIPILKKDIALGGKEGRPRTAPYCYTVAAHASSNLVRKNQSFTIRCKTTHLRLLRGFGKALQKPLAPRIRCSSSCRIPVFHGRSAIMGDHTCRPLKVAGVLCKISPYKKKRFELGPSG